MSDPALYARVRLALAAIAVVAALVAISALIKRETCACGDHAFPWTAIAIGAAAACALALAAYAALGQVARRISNPP